LLAAEGRVADAASYYHRAIYGSWHTDAARARAAARLELARFLAKQGARQELLSELLLLDQAQPEVAALFLEAGSAARAAEAYRAALRRDPGDAGALTGLGEAELLRYNYHAARNAFREALRSKPEDAAIAARLQLAETLAELDPTSRRLSSAEKYRRSAAILARVQEELSACAQAPPAPAVRGPVTNEMSEKVLQTAEDLWKQRLKACPQPPGPDDPLPVLFRELAQ
jgi:tetratricopeptide (TPR) repeat protein